MAHPTAGASRKWVSPRDNPLVIVRRARELLRQEGLTGLLAGAGRYLRWVLQWVYTHELLRAYHLSVAEAAAMRVTPPGDNVQVYVIESREDAMRLSEEGFESVLEAVPGAERRLRCGAVAACAFLGRELASIDWMALSERAKPAVDSFPYRADFASSDACTGGAYTMPHLRGKGLAAYRFSAQVAYLYAKGRRTCYNAIAVDNIPSQRTVERYGATFDAVFRHRRFMGRDSFRQVWSRAKSAGPQT